jgi:hypothetical protein
VSDVVMVAKILLELVPPTFVPVMRHRIVARRVRPRSDDEPNQQRVQLMPEQTLFRLPRRLEVRVIAHLSQAVQRCGLGRAAHRHLNRQLRRRAGAALGPPSGRRRKQELGSKRQQPPLPSIIEAELRDWPGMMQSQPPGPASYRSKSIMCTHRPRTTAINS